MELKKTKKRFRLFDMNRDGKGVDPGEDRTPNLKFFFKQYGRKFSKLLTLNMMTMFQILPLAAAVILYFFFTPTTATFVSPEYPLLYGMQSASSTAVSCVNMGIFSYQFGIPEHGTPIYIVIVVIVALLVITYGWQKVGTVYVTRGLVRGDSVFVWSDYFYAIKKNFWQGLGVGLFDCLIMGVLAYNFFFFHTAEQTGFHNFLYATTIALIFIYLVMRFYIYLMVVTFNIKTFKAFKNALIFVVLGIKRNLMACLGLIAVTAIAVLPILMFFPKFGVVIVLPLIYYLGTCSFIYIYAAYPVVKKYMIDPATPKAPATVQKSQDE